jgi:C_GCAxxG_C_C family probable redox protein
LLGRGPTIPQRAPNRTMDIEELAGLIGRKAENLFRTRQLDCAEAVLCTLNQGLGGGLPPSLAVRIASGLTEGIGGAGCTCGALSGAVVGLGLFLGRNGPGLRNGRLVRTASRRLHDAFRDRFGATCCRVLTLSKNGGALRNLKHCSGQTEAAAEAAARIILELRPELAQSADLAYLSKKDSRIKGRLKTIRGTAALME